MYGAVTHHFEQPTTLAARLRAAELLRGELVSRGGAELPMYVDGMENLASLSFGALPERLVVIQHGKVAFIGGKGPEEYLHSRHTVGVVCGCVVWWVVEQGG